LNRSCKAIGLRMPRASREIG